MSQFGTFFLSELGNWFSILFFSNLLVLDTSPVNLDGFVEAFAFNTALIDTWVVCVLIITVFPNVFSKCTFLDAIDITTCSLCNLFEGDFPVCPDLLLSLHMAFNCSFKSVSNNSACAVC